jgi:Galactose oxidase, central domain/Kelch motif
MRKLNTKSNFLALAGISLATLVLGPARLASAQVAASSWSYTGNLNTARVDHSATLLPDGKVLVAGGYDNDNALNSAELYDPATGRWSITGNLNTAGGGTATLLPNGKVLVTRGLNSPELYDPATGTWSITGKLNTAGGGTATLLPNGKVLVAGGSDNHSFLNRAELYDPATGTWSITGNLNTARVDHTATLLPNGKVLVAGGFFNNCSSGCSALNSAELYDPATGTWSTTGNLNSAPQSHTATLLPNGKVLVAADTGYGELYNPATGTWSDTGNLNTIRYGHTGTLLPSGKVLVAAGVDSGGDNVLSIDNAELYDSTTGMWSYTGSLNTGRASHTMTLLANGRVLVAGGRDYDYDALSSAELFGSSTALPQITGASISGKKLFVEGQNFDAGARIILNDERQKTANDELTATTLLIGKKAGNWIGFGETVRLKVRNSDGTESAEFSYTRPAQ